MAVRFDPLNSGYLQGPYPTYTALRREEPVKRVRFRPLTIARGIRRFASKQREMGEPGLLRTLLQARRRRAAGDGPNATLRLPRGIFAVSRYADVSYVLRHPRGLRSLPIRFGP